MLMKIILINRKTVYLVLAVLWAAVIFSFSARNADESTKESRRAGKLICSIFVPGFSDMTEERQYEMAGEIDYSVRKLAHGTEYAVLGILLAGAVYDTGRKRYYNLIVSYIAGTLYAATDELHQYFVPERSCRLADVFIDSIGVLSGIVISLAIIKIHYKLHGCRR